MACKTQTRSEPQRKGFTQRLCFTFGVTKIGFHHMRLTMTLTGVRAILSAAHRGPENKLHGHTWEVVAWFHAAGEDARNLKGDLLATLELFDHDILPDSLSRGEDLAEWLGTELTGCVQVDVSRPLEGFFARWTA